MVSKTDTPSKAVALPDQVPPEVIAGITSFEDAMAYFNANEGTVNAGDVLGDGFTIIKDKDVLINIPFLILDWREVLGDQGLYASVRLITSDGRKYRIADGSTGILSQLSDLVEKDVTRGIFVKAGLVKSEYWIDENGNIFKDRDKVPEGATVKPGSTFYLATA